VSLVAVIIGIPVLLAVAGKRPSRSTTHSIRLRRRRRRPRRRLGVAERPARHRPASARGSLVRPFAVAKFVKNNVPNSSKLVYLFLPERAIAHAHHDQRAAHHYVQLPRHQTVKINGGGFGTEQVIRDKIDASAPRGWSNTSHSKNVTYCSSTTSTAACGGSPTTRTTTLRGQRPQRGRSPVG
jgi:hypothetical protein